MIKMNLNGTNYFVGDGIELRRIWRKAVHQKGYSSGYVDTPRYNLIGTYCIFFDKNKIHWDNFNKLARNGVQHFNKTMPNYRCFNWIEGGLNDAKCIYEGKKLCKKYRF